MFRIQLILAGSGSLDPYFYFIWIWIWIRILSGSSHIYKTNINKSSHTLKVLRRHIFSHPKNMEKLKKPKFGVLLHFSSIFSKISKNISKFWKFLKKLSKKGQKSGSRKIRIQIRMYWILDTPKITENTGSLDPSGSGSFWIRNTA